MVTFSKFQDFENKNVVLLRVDMIHIPPLPTSDVYMVAPRLRKKIQCNYGVTLRYSNWPHPDWSVLGERTMGQAEESVLQVIRQHG